jgi:Flp pilus assembly protein TadD
MTSKLFVRLTASAALAALALSCQQLQKMNGTAVDATVVVPESNGSNTSFVVEASADRSCEQGVRELRNGNWEKAVTAFQQALLSDPDDHRAHFGMGVAYEQLGKNDLALQHYQTANRIPRAQNELYSSSIVRAQSKLQS